MAAPSEPAIDGLRPTVTPFARQSVRAGMGLSVAAMAVAAADAAARLLAVSPDATIAPLARTSSVSTADSDVSSTSAIYRFEPPLQGRRFSPYGLGRRYGRPGALRR